MFLCIDVYDRCQFIKSVFLVVTSFLVKNHVLTEAGHKNHMYTALQKQKLFTASNKVHSFVSQCFSGEDFEFFILKL